MTLGENLYQHPANPEETVYIDADAEHVSLSAIQAQLDKRRAVKPSAHALGGRDIVSDYLDQASQYPLLHKEEEVQLSRLIYRGRNAQDQIDKAIAAKQTPHQALLQQAREGKAAKELFFNSNLRLVVSVAKRYPLPPGMDLMDLIQEGNIGLEHAIDLFDHTKGFKFSTYAIWWIKQAIGRGIEQQGHLIRLPSHQHVSLKRARNIAEQQLNNSEDAVEFEDLLDDNTLRLHRLINPKYLNAPLKDDAVAERIDFMKSSDPSPEDMTVLQAERQNVLELVNTLDERSQYVIRRHFGLIDGERYSLAQISEELGISREMVRRIAKSALASMKNNLKVS